MAEKYPDQSSYSYCGNSPIIYRDPDGNDRIYSATGKFLEDTGKGNNLIVRTKGGDFKMSQLNYKHQGTRVTGSR